MKNAESFIVWTGNVYGDRDSVWIFSQTFSERRIIRKKILCSRMAVVFFDFFWNL